MAPAHQETAARRSRGRLLAVLILTGGFMLVEVAGAVFTGSLALAADAGHMLTDVGGLALALFAVWIAARPPTPAKTFGYYRVEILAALVNALLLLAVAGWILVESYQRILAPPEVLGGPMMVIAALGLGVNVLGAWLLHPGATASLNVRAAYLEVLSDALSSIGVLAAAGVVTWTGWNVVDPLVSAAIAIFIVPRTWRLLAQAVNVLLEGTPAHLKLDEIEEAMTQVPGVRRVHDLHVWTLTSGREAMSAHVVVDHLGESERLLEELHAVLHARFGIDHTTIQLEKEPSVVLRFKGPSS
ncbi:MAG: cation transporter [Candidatus Rokubacteria bacterium 13_1_40CM_69_27]|nr:MAG: cation transporter [Candidatus Rokubacteria bacterium 13_1_40CM_69_27]OLC37477.1 MAG: cation transporter [Candidatus Rokubacteria bacterium 13_1_40CM_4_69_5]OLE37145.1 MAG: cation transporter [Candidatus Rokubacteria bacterium 13_1_20CM_2_70_7]